MKHTNFNDIRNQINKSLNIEFANNFRLILKRHPILFYDLLPYNNSHQFIFSDLVLEQNHKYDFAWQIPNNSESKVYLMNIEDTSNNKHVLLQNFKKEKKHHWLKFNPNNLSSAHFKLFKCTKQIKVITVSNFNYNSKYNFTDQINNSIRYEHKYIHIDFFKHTLEKMPTLNISAPEINIIPLKCQSPINIGKNIDIWIH